MEVIQVQDLSPRDLSPPRKARWPNREQKERQWFETAYLKPNDETDRLDTNVIKEFQHLIWETPANTIISKYCHTPNDMAILCGEGSDGWLLNSHITWVCDKLNTSQQKAINLVLNYSAPEDLKRLKDKMSETVEYVNFVVNVGKNVDGTVFISSAKRSGNHWVLVSVDLSSSSIPIVFYCDSLGWDCPPNLLNCLTDFVQTFDSDIDKLEHLVYMHKHTASGHGQCTSDCRNYPKQTCSNVCGLVAVMCTVISTLDTKLFKELTGPRSDCKLFLHEPTKYEKYLRRILIHWFTTGKIDITLLQQKCHITQTSETDHSYSFSSSSSKLSRKRKATNSSQNQSNYTNITSIPANSNNTNTIIIEATKETQDTVLITEPSDTDTTNSSQNQSNYTNTDKDTLSKKEHICEFCTFQFSCRQSLYKHKKRKHSSEQSASNTTTTTHCKCNLCSFSAHTIHDLILHYNCKHNKKFTVNTKIFKNAEEFILWKNEIEKTTSSHYVLNRGSQKNENCIVSYYYCHRSGNKRIVENPKRSRKCQGSCKIDNYCTSYLNVTKNINDSTISVNYCLNHCGHSSQLAHLNISHYLRAQIAGKLASGVEAGTILDFIREDISSVDRDSLLTRKDIHNIKHQYNISQSQKHKEDGCSVDLWVKQFEDDENNPIVFYKPQNSHHDILQINDFLLCIQTKFQKEMMLKHGSSIICVDSTHGTTQYDFLLVSLLVLDDYQEAIPVAWAITNSERCEILEIFMSEIHKSCGQDVKTQIFMSDMADNFYKAWCTSFSQPYKRLYCSWHIDKSWRIKINCYVKNEQTRCYIYALLKLLQNETDEKKFRKMLQEFLSFLKTELNNFYNYFTENYVNDDKLLLWAACFRLGTVANTNMYAEAFHNVLKGVYFNRKQNRRVDNLLLILLKISRDKMIEQIIKYEKGKITYRITEMRARHKKAEGIIGIKEICEKEWTVPSSSQTEITYTVHNVLSAPCSCKLTCNFCFVCVHMYSCTCTDYLIKSLSCKHIHAVHMTRNNERPLVIQEGDCSDDAPTLNFLKSLVHQDKPEACDDVDRLKTIGLGKANNIISLINSSNKSTVLRALIDGLQNAYTIACGLQELDSKQKLEIKHEYSSTKHFETQHRFVSTKRKATKRFKFKLKNPNTSDKIQLADELSSKTANVCALCFSAADKMGNITSEFFECVSCKCLIHVACDVPVGTTLEGLAKCSACRD